ncbi:jg11035 [Pararge aegeria aegeria]|uniref:Phospholipid scramblase n=1 Tax=Pararge aegeria aegeria TaxID=348720 RepID=A0A8S4SB61_9NEOP|nr:jg11035 [Pararge aegeria aegeria]
MTTPESSTGIEMLKTIDRVLIREKTGTYTNNKYVVLTADGTVLLYAKEDSGILNRMLVGKSRAFEIDVFDTSDLEVIGIGLSAPNDVNRRHQTSRWEMLKLSGPGPLILELSTKDLCPAEDFNRLKR